MKEYEDILFLSHFEPQFHPRMGKNERAAQFAPFAALTGYYEEIEEKGRRTDSKKVLAEDQKERLNQKLKEVQLKMSTSIVMITYFVKDERKKGGCYQKEIGKIKKIDFYHKKIIMESKKSILFSDITDISFD